MAFIVSLDSYSSVLPLRDVSDSDTPIQILNNTEHYKSTK